MITTNQITQAQQIKINNNIIAKGNIIVDNTFCLTLIKNLLIFYLFIIRMMDTAKVNSVIIIRVR